jgi:MHS family proline/betaine transporter-like MFS transporter
MKLSLSMKALIAGISGTALQWYDFSIFGYFAPLIAITFFPENNAIVGLLNTFTIFAVGYLLAPLGAVVFGYIGDRYGRKRALTLSILGMAFSTALMSILPGFQSIGILAPALVTLIRIVQGFVASSEFTGSAIFLVEYAKPERKAFYGCLTSSAYSTGVILAGLIASLLTASFMPSWSWRLGFALALIAGIIIFYLRTRIDETPIYQAIHDAHKPKLPFLAAIKVAPLAFIGVIGLAWLIGVMTFGTYVFAESFVHHYFNIPLSTMTLITTLALAVDAFLEPLIAIVADKIGRLRVMIFGVSLTLLFSFPIFYLLTTANVLFISLGMILLSILIATAFAPMNTYMVELFPETCRYSGFGVAFNIGISLFGGTTPLVMMWLVETTHNYMAPAYYYVWGAIVCLVSLVICERSRRKTFDSQFATVF